MSRSRNRGRRRPGDELWSRRALSGIPKTSEAKRLSRRIQRKRDARALRSEILALLAAHPGIDDCEIAERLGLVPVEASEALHAMARQGFVRAI